ncbi:hypothetical protein M0R45_014985 [Rubus argutus]|uniref:Uncharacterized protein n=1 Tax=Rubus argutus TaxID=59490 RepID=A0AAW1XQD6_RUBAR
MPGDLNTASAQREQQSTENEMPYCMLRALNTGEAQVERQTSENYLVNRNKVSVHLDNEASEFEKSFKRVVETGSVFLVGPNTRNSENPSLNNLFFGSGPNVFKASSESKTAGVFTDTNNHLPRRLSEGDLLSHTWVSGKKEIPATKHNFLTKFGQKQGSKPNLRYLKPMDFEG